MVTFLCERAGFEIFEVPPFFPGPLRLFNRLTPVSNLIDGCTYVGRAIEGWEYIPRATRRIIDNP